MYKFKVTLHFDYTPVVQKIVEAENYPDAITALQKECITIPCTSWSKAGKVGYSFQVVEE